VYDIHPPAVYVHERALCAPEGQARVERMLANVHCDREPEVVDDARLNEISRENDWRTRCGWRTGQWDLTGDPVLIFNAFTWEAPDVIAERRSEYPGLAFRMLDGAGAWTFRRGSEYYGARRTVCQDAWEIHSAWGCLHRCDYCHIGGFLNIMVNLEEFVERLPELLAENPGLQLYKYDNQTDTIAFEPEYGASELLVGFFAEQPGRYLMLYTKSDNVDHLLPLDHRGHTIVSFTISSPTVARAVEKGTPDTVARIGAAAKVQGAGYIPRVRFSPIVPVEGWRDENGFMVRELLSSVHPDIITMDLLGWMSPEKIGEIVDTSLIDPRFLERMRELFRGGPPGPQYYPTSKHIFPHELRLEVYEFILDEVRRLNGRVRVALCNESIEMWEELGSRLGMAPENYVCGCGPTSVPGNPLLAAGSSPGASY
jgi:spore photoproduct lyase